MTEFQSIMLSVCFGAVIGMFAGALVSCIRSLIELRKLKKREKELKEKQKDVE